VDRGGDDSSVRARIPRFVSAGCSATFLFSFFSVVAVSGVEAQGRRKGHVLHHDSSNPPPGHARGKGKGRHKTPSMSIVSAAGVIMSPPVQVATSRAVMGVQGMLRARALESAEGIALSLKIQTDLAALIDGSSDFAVLEPILEVVEADQVVEAEEAEEADDDQAQRQLDF
jgi:hypothetical protein